MGRRGSVLLGPTEHRVARWLADRTSNGRVSLRAIDMAPAIGVERSELYRITARLRTLGLFGVENDRGGHKGGRRYWRTAVARPESSGLDSDRHRMAWARILSWARARAARLAARLRDLSRQGQYLSAALPALSSPGIVTLAGAADDRGRATFAERMRRAGLGSLMAEWQR